MSLLLEGINYLSIEEIRMARDALSSAVDIGEDTEAGAAAAALLDEI